MSFQVTFNPAIINLKEWSEFVKEHPFGNVFQTPEYYNAYAQNDENYSLITAILEVPARKILGLVVVVILKEGHGLKGFFSRRAIIMGPPLAKDNDKILIDVLLSNLTSYLKDKVIFTQFRNMFDMTNYKYIFEKHGYLYEEHLNILIDFTDSEEILWKNINSKCRNKIRKAEKENIIVKEISGLENLRSAYLILRDSYSRAGIPILKYNSFASVFNHLKRENILRIFASYDEDKMIGTRIQLCYLDRVYDWYAGSYKEYYSKCPNEYLTWFTFLSTKRDGFRLFDFGGAGKPGVPYGVRDYKLKFGGEVVNYGRFTILNHKLLFTIGKIFMKLYKLKRSR